MALVTLCPGCRTTFRVTPQQLKAHGGDVRCGKCWKVFNSFATLVTVEESEIGNSVRLVNIDLSKKDLSARLEPETGPAEDTEKKLTSYFSVPGSTQISLPDPTYNFDAVPSRNIPYYWFPAGFFIFLIILVLVALFYRGEIISAKPETRPIFERICIFFLCNAPYPKDITLLSIESSDLQVDPEKNAQTAGLMVIIRNHATFTQELPVLKLTLTDRFGQNITSLFYTADYYLDDLDGDVGSSQGIGANQELVVDFNISLPDKNASGYRISLLYR